MKILLINPPTTLRGHDHTEPGAFPPLGLAYVAAVLERDNYDVRILDALALGISNVQKSNGATRFGISENDIRRYLRGYDPDIVGIQCMYTAYAQDAHDVARLVKDANPNTPVVMGGAHASVAPDEVLKDKNVDLTVKGEGETTFLELVRCLERRNDISRVQGTITRKDDKIITNPPRAYIQDLDSLPFPARHLLPMDLYLSQSSKNPYNMRHPHAEMITSRGCRASCIFCSIHSIWGHTWRARSPTNVVDEIELLVDKYNVGEIHFVDDNISLDRKRMIEICEEIKKRKIDIKWTTPNGIAIYTLDEKVLEKMRQSGCYRLTFGIESGCYETQRFIGKRINLDRARALVRHANNIGIWTIATFIIGFPYESKDSITDTINFAINSDLDFAVFYLPIPFPGTRLRDIYEKENLLNPSSVSDIGLLFSATGGVDTLYFTSNELKELQKYAYSKFIRSSFSRLSNPMHLVKKIRSFEDLKYVTRLGKNAIDVLYNEFKYRSRIGYRPIGMRKGD